MILIFVPGAKALSNELRSEHGLDLLMPSGQMARESMAGPHGKSGLLVVENSADAAGLLRFDGEKQSWSTRFGFTSFVGHWNDRRPSEKCLARNKTLPGERIALIDGASWLVPTLRKWAPELRYTIELPTVLQQCESTGRLVRGEVVPAYRPVWEQSLSVADTLMQQATNSGSAEIDDKLMADFVASVLQLNYKVDLTVISHLQLLSEPLFAAVVRSALDWDALESTLKKRIQSSGMSSGSGATQPTAE